MPNAKQLKFLGDFTRPVLALESSCPVPGAARTLSTVTIAQACIEAATPPEPGDVGAVTDKGGWGTSPLYLSQNNPFGIQFSQRDAEYGFFDYQSWEIENGQKVKKIEHFQKYPDLQTAIQDHQRLLLMKQAVIHALLHATGSMPWLAVCAALCPPLGNYSTNPLYVMTLQSIITHCRLDDDRMLAWYATGEDPARRPA